MQVVELGTRTLENHYVVECFDKDGNLKWAEEFDNLVTTEGLNDSLNKHFKASAYTASWFVGLVNGASAPTYAAGDTLASHAGWTELAPGTAYTGNRQALTLGTVAAGSVDNSASKAVFPILANNTVAGAFICTAATGTSGILYGEGNFTGGNRSVVNGDTLNVTITLTAS